MPQMPHLMRQLASLDGLGFKAYSSIRGSYDCDGCQLVIEHVQPDPFAELTRLRATLQPAFADLPPWSRLSPARRTATADFLNRRLHQDFSRRSTDLGSGHGGQLHILAPGQEVLQRSSLSVKEDGSVEARFGVGLPARGRRILGRAAASLLGNVIVDAIAEALRFESIEPKHLARHVETVENARALRQQLGERGLVAFIADGAILPRRSGIDDRPLDSASTTPFRTPPSLAVTLNTPNAGTITGLGIPAGVTLIAGGGFHGKSTLLRAIERGIYDHIPGDGREAVVAAPGTVKVRAEEGRPITGTDIRSFFRKLPADLDTGHFHTTNASGSTSQAAAICEALELGATCLLLDEDTSAANFMIRDGRMQALIPAGLEPIIPYIDRARDLAANGVSTIVVLGGSGDYFDVADTVIAMREFVPADLTHTARSIAVRLPTGRTPESAAFQPPRCRAPVPASIDARRRRKDTVRTLAPDRILFGTQEISLSGVEQFVETAQMRAAALALLRVRDEFLDGERDLRQALDLLFERIRHHGLDCLSTPPRADLAEFRPFEAAALLNRLRSLRVRRPASEARPPAAEALSAPSGGTRLQNPGAAPSAPTDSGAGNPARRRFIVIGHVQGVGFRWWARKQARALQLAGRVRNLRDGSVEVEAAGPPESLRRLAERLGSGPPAASVVRVEELPPTAGALPPRFEIAS